MSLLWALDLGGTKIELIVSQSESLTSPILRRRAPTEAQKGYATILKNTVDLVQGAAKELSQNPEVLGVSCCGTVVPASGLMKNCNATALNGKPFPSDLARTLNCETLFANDANCFAYAEAKLGGGREGNSVFGVILGTGVGGGLVFDGRMYQGAHGLGGEWGHNVLEENGAPCYCGKRGCVEQCVSGPALERFYRERTGTELPLKEIALRASHGTDAAASELIERFLSLLGRALGTVVNVIDPDVIVLGGGASNIDQLYSALPRYMEPWIFGGGVEIPVRRAVLGDSAGVFGAALLAREKTARS